ncbi:arginase [Pseudobacteriovorax antillogorgiicola]|uniref:Arginase n=2 Tax=Pseudobacteriovorax antillogorgiicola TaxID=1513793 RepID=A0A1Y6CN32_9BACT|nr:arginase [Pseudobacteriovorax antillogorgiicola]SMF79065.1 arginase [Pseudobacteriovorax antillogorgiicola]
MGPAALRIAGLKKKIEIQGYKVRDIGDLFVPVRDSLSQEIQDEKFLQPLTQICEDLCGKTHNAVQSGNIPLVVGGDHSIAIGTISGIAKHHKEQGGELGVVWVDAHADINTPDSSPSGNIHGMPLATLMGDGHPELCKIGGDGPKLKPENVALIGIRTIDDDEKRVLKASGVNYYSMRDIDERGMFRVMKEAIEKVSANTKALHVSFDIDGIDPRYAPGVSTPVSGGLTLREAHLLLEMLYETKKLGSLEFVELNPYTDVGAQSANLTVDLILSALGKSIV